ncbi:MAG: hypothetical protein EOM10_02160 [Opitutae bacterium]|nr:hypothetical protein [Opitutae bacterium]
MSPRPASPGPRPDPNAPLQASGLPPRIRAALRKAGAARIGDLARPLPPDALPDADDRALLQRVAAWCAAAGSGSGPPRLNLPEWLRLFLTPRLADALRIHYGLDEPAAALARHESTLRDTGFKLGVTRERARQLLQLAFDTLRRPVPLHAAEPLFGAAEQAAREAGGVLDAPALAELRHPAWGGLSPAGAFLLLARLLPGRLVRYRDFFSVWSDIQLDRTEKALRDRLAAAAEPQPVKTLARDLPADARPPGVPSPAPLLRMLLRHMPDTFATLDDRGGFIDRHAAGLLCEILADTGEAPLRTLTAEFNRRLHPECRRGSGTLRTLLGRDPRIRKTAPGRYALPGGLQTRLPLDS